MGRPRKPQLRSEAREMRESGHSYQEISRLLGIAKSTAAVWTRDIVLGRGAQYRLDTYVGAARERSGWTRTATKQSGLAQLVQDETPYVQAALRDQTSDKLLCALIYWCEGAKGDTVLKFTNSDPNLVRRFLALLRRSFVIDEHKLRAIIHLHEYHNPRAQTLFWSKMTNIPIEQFYKPYQKLSSGKRRRKGYPGCICVSYYDAWVARRLLTIARLYLDPVS